MIRPARLLLTAASLLVLLALRTFAANPVFLVEPYLQLGNAPTAMPREQLELHWETDRTPRHFAVEVRRQGTLKWRAVAAPAEQLVTRPENVPYVEYCARLDRLTPGAKYDYQLKCNGAVVFQSVAMARKPPGAATRFVVFGDCGQGSEDERGVACHAFELAPDFVVIVGDVVYYNGRTSEYRTNYYPFFNADRDDPKVGAPLLRSVLTLSNPGNHDTGHGRGRWSGHLNEFPDGLAWYLEWSEPLNGPDLLAGSPNVTPIEADTARRDAFLTAARTTFPRMANFSFDYGNTHWTMLDSNEYVDWSTPALRKWVENDIRSSHARWHIVAFHHPGFNASRKHFNEQQMRVLADVFERCGVNVVISGHDHNYERTCPIRFTPRRQPDGTFRKADGEVEGTLVLDHKWDGIKNTRPHGVIYVISGEGGADLQDPKQQDAPQTWQPFTLKMFSRSHSFTLVDANDHRLDFTQIDASGHTVDHFVISR